MTGIDPPGGLEGPGRPLVVLGDALLDRDITGTVDRVCPDAPVPVVRVGREDARPGGAALAAVLARRATGRPVRLVTALGDDAAGRQIAELLAEAGVDLVDLGSSGVTPQKVRVRAASQSLVRLDHEGEPAPPDRPERALDALDDAAAVLVADYGRGLTATPGIREALTATAGRVPVVWDPHHRGAPPVAGCRLITPNRSEAGHFSSASAEDRTGEQRPALATVIGWALSLVDRWAAHNVAVTLGGDGALVVDRAGTPHIVPAPAVTGGDPCGAGDCFSAAATAALADGALPSEAVERAVTVAATFVGAGGAASWSAVAVPGPPSPAVPASTGIGVGTLVATGGCFDLLHPGHIGLLEGARRLGDRLVVLINSDASVRRLKGPDRPVQSAEDRAAVLRSLSCVDDVVIFDEDTPEVALEALRPDLFVKGGDYTIADLPEATTLARWGGRAVVLPYLPGRSTTRLLEEASRHDVRPTRH